MKSTSHRAEKANIKLVQENVQLLPKTLKPAEET